MSGGKRGAVRRLDGFDGFVRKCMRDWNVPGVAVGIVADGRTILAKGFGLRDVRRKRPVTPETHFAIGSCTKAFTTTVMGMLVDDGKLDWDAPVREYLPEFRMHDSVATEQMTPRDLVTHRSGLPRHDMVWVNTTWSRDEVFRRLRYLQPSKGLRSLYQYNNLMFMAAGVVVERVAGCPWEEFVRQRICEPLDMRSVTFANVEMARAEDFALGYDRVGRRLLRVEHENVVPVGPAGSMNANVLDMCRWVELQLSGGKVGRRRLIKPETLKEIHTPQMVFKPDYSYDELLDPSYAMGWSVQPYRGHRRLSHGGCVDGFNCSTAFLPNDGIGVVVLTNVTDSCLPRVIQFNVYDRLLGLDPINWSRRLFGEERAARRKLSAEAAAKHRARRKNTHPTHPLRDYAGQYEHPGYGVLTISLKKGRLEATYNGLTRPLEHYHYDAFEMVQRRTWPWRKMMTFHVGERGRITSLSAALQEGVDDIRFKRVDATAAASKARSRR